MSSNRDDFHQAVIDSLAKRAVYTCSNPSCNRPTLEPSPVDPMQYIYTGIAAHITAASPGGARYDASLTRAARSSIDNGIHLCEVCAAKIDKNNGKDFSVVTLNEWKAKHEEHIHGLHEDEKNALETKYFGETTRAISKDILMLRRWTGHHLTYLSEFSKIETGQGRIHIQRSCTNAIVDAVNEDSLLVVGEPGAGKSGAIYDAIEKLAIDGFSVVLLSADDLDATSLGALTNELRLAMPIQDVLANWPSDKPGLLVIDGLDAAKSSGNRSALRSLIRVTQDLGSRWQVLASIRKFDLRYGADIQDQFRGTPVDGFVDPEFVSVRHLNVPTLTDSELEQIDSQVPLIGKLIQSASPQLSQLLRLPFNVRLFADCVKSGATTEDTSPIVSQIELLELYWQKRVVKDDPLGDAREAILRSIVAIMVETRSMRLDRSAIASVPMSSEPLNTLLRDHVIQEWASPTEIKPDRDVLAFGHHILFDYSVARLMFRGTPSRFLQVLSDNPSYAVSLRASIQLHLHYVWSRDTTRVRFWELAFSVLDSGVVSAIAKIMPIVVVAELAHNLEEFEPLVSTLTNEATQESALIALGYLSGALVSSQRGVCGQGAPPCSALLRRVTQEGPFQAGFRIVPLVMAIVNQMETLSEQERDDIGATSRRLLEIAWEGAA